MIDRPEPTNCMSSVESASRPSRYRDQRLWLVGLIASFAIASGGSATFTVVGTSNGVSTYLVVSGNSDDVAQLKDYYTSGGGGGQVVDGEHHSGELICTHNSSKNGHVLHFALYGGVISAEQCQQIFAGFP
jgi:hypothetical protein